MDIAHKGQLLIDIATRIVDENENDVIALLSTVPHRYHRMAVYAAVMCDNINIIKMAIPEIKTAPAVQCCSLTTTDNTIPDILRVDSRNSLTMICIEYDAIDCFDYLHKITNEDLNDIITKALKYRAQKILAHIAATPELKHRIVNEARKKGLTLMI